MRKELDTLAIRDESLQKDNNQSRMKIKELARLIDEQIESAFIDKTIDMGEEIGDPSQLGKEQIISRFVEILDAKGEIDTEAPKTVENLRGLEKEYVKKVKDLEIIEEKFNQCVAIIPETDENTIRLTNDIQKLKERLDAANKDFIEAKESLNVVRQQRKDKFLLFFNKISDQLPVNYRELTQN